VPFCCWALPAPSDAASSLRSRSRTLRRGPEGLLIAIRQGKTDQEGLGRKVAIPRGDVACPVEAVKAWQEDALFRRVWNKRKQRVRRPTATARIVADIVRRLWTRTFSAPTASARAW